MMGTLGPRIVIAGTHSGVGKTTVATGLMAAFRRRGLKVASAKVGPDFIDPGYHALATGRPGRNLDGWMCGASRIGPLAGRAAEDADLLVVEGVMGLFDGAADDGDTSSTAHVAELLDAPVILVVDASAMSRSVAAVVYGFLNFEPRLRVAGVILNQVGSEGHALLLREALVPLDVPILGVLYRDDALRWRDRHLGLVPVVEHAERVTAALDRLGAAIDRDCDLDPILSLARAAPAKVVESAPTARPSGRARIAVAGGIAFSFTYPDNLELLTQAGAELVPFDPRHDPVLPDGVNGLLVGGGFPEVYGAELAANDRLLTDVRARVEAGLVTWAECGGLLWLAHSLDGAPMCGVIAAHGRMTDRLTLGYRRATLGTATPIGPAGTQVRGHEFHYSSLEPPGDAIELTSRFGSGRAGYATPTLLASYLHLHLASDPHLAERFVVACTADS